MNENVILQIIDSMNNTIQKTDDINKRLINCIYVVTISFCICISIMIACYFFSDYDYISLQQESITEDTETRQRIN